MKKIAKMSLVAAMAISGLTSASAADLTEAIKGVKISGFVSYTMEKVNNAKITAAGATKGQYSSDKSEAQHDIDVRIQAVIPVNDMVTATIRLDEANDDDTDATGSAAVDSNSLRLELDRVYFTYKNAKFSTSFGLMQVPLTDAAQGDGITASYDFGAAKVNAGYFYTTAEGSDEVAFISVAGSIAPVSYYATYASVLDADATTTGNRNGTTDDNKGNFLHLGVSGNIEMISLALDYSQKTDLSTGNEDQNQYKVSVGADLGMVTLGLAYAANDKDGGNTLVDGSDVAASEISVGDLELHGLGDASAIQASVSVDVNATNNVKLVYAAADVEGTNMDQDVIKVIYTNMMSKNFSVYANYEINDKDSSDDKMTELTLGAKYSF